MNAIDSSANQSGATTETCDECGLSLAEAHEQPAGYVAHTLDGETLCGACDTIRRGHERRDRKTADELAAVTDGGEPAGSGCECLLRGCGNEIPAERDDGYCSDRCQEASAEMREALEQNRRAERRAAGEADVPRVADDDTITDGGQLIEALPGNREVAESETATDHGGVWADEHSRGCETCGDTESFERKAARLPDGMVANVCPTCYGHLRGRGATSGAGYAPSEVGE